MSLLKHYDGKRPSGLILTKTGAEELQKLIDHVDPVTMTSPWVVGAGLEITVDHYLPEDAAGIVINGEVFRGTIKKGGTP